MTSLPALNSQVRGTMPTLGNSSIRSNNNEHVKHIMYSDMGSSANKFGSGTTSIKPNNIAIKPFVPAAKLTLDGKVVDIDVLTKLQQQNGGNIVSFTASKEFLSNLTSGKNNSSKITGPPKSRVNKQDVSVFKSMTGKKNQEKVLLPKNQINGFTQKPRIEVKKFAPEIKGLLSGLSTAFKTTSTVSVNTTNCSRDVRSGSPFQPPNLSSKIINDHTSQNLLLAVKTTGHVTTPTLNVTNTVGNNHNSMPQITSNHSNRQPQAPPLKKLSWNCLPSTSSVIVPNSAVRNNTARTQSVITSAGSNKLFPFKTSYNQFEIAHSLKQSNQVICDDTRRRSPPTCNINMKKDDYVHTADFGPRSRDSYDSQYHYVKNTREIPKPSHTFRNVNHNTKNEMRMPMKKEVKSSVFENANNPPISKASIANFTELYENAVRNVLNIKAFSESFTNVTNTASYSKQIEKAFDTYLKRPVEFDIKLERFQYAGTPRRQDSFDSNHLNGEPCSKIVRTDENMTNTNINDNRANSCHPSPEKMNPAFTMPRYNSPHDDPMEYFKLFDFKRRQEEEKKTNQYESQNKFGEVDNRNFFAQFLSDQTFLSQHQPPSYYSPADFPWLYPSYMYEKYYQATLPYYYYGDYRTETLNDKVPTTNYGDYLAETLNEQFSTSKSPKYEEENTRQIISPAHEKVEEQSPTRSEYSTISEPTFRMKLNTIPISTEQPILMNGEIKEEPVSSPASTISSPTTQDAKKKCKNKKDVEKIKAPLKGCPVQSRKLKIKECLKYRPYSLRQRVKELKKAEKIAQLKPKQPKYVLKDMNAKNLTKKEIFLGHLGLWRILKRNDRKSGEGK